MDIDRLKSVDGRINMADTLSKDNADFLVRLNEMMASGIWCAGLSDK